MADETQSGPVLVMYSDGRSYVVTDAAASAEHHPDAHIVAYESDAPFDPEHDASLAAAREAEAKKRVQQTKVGKQPPKDAD